MSTPHSNESLHSTQELHAAVNEALRSYPNDEELVDRLGDFGVSIRHPLEDESISIELQALSDSPGFELSRIVKDFPNEQRTKRLVFRLSTLSVTVQSVVGDEVSDELEVNPSYFDVIDKVVSSTLMAHRKNPMHDRIPRAAFNAPTEKEKLTLPAHNRDKGTHSLVAACDELIDPLGESGEEAKSAMRVTKIADVGEVQQVSKKIPLPFGEGGLNFSNAGTQIGSSDSLPGTISVVWPDLDVDTEFDYIIKIALASGEPFRVDGMEVEHNESGHLSAQDQPLLSVLTASISGDEIVFRGFNKYHEPITLKPVRKEFMRIVAGLRRLVAAA